MNDPLLLKLERTFRKCSDGMLYPEYVPLLNELCNIELSQNYVDFLCDKVTQKSITGRYDSSIFVFYC